MGISALLAIVELGFSGPELVNEGGLSITG